MKRRDFIKGVSGIIGAATAGLIIPYHAMPREKKNTEKVFDMGKNTKEKEWVFSYNDDQAYVMFNRRWEDRRSGPFLPTTLLDMADIEELIRITMRKLEKQRYLDMARELEEYLYIRTRPFPKHPFAPMPPITFPRSTNQYPGIKIDRP